MIEFAQYSHSGIQNRGVKTLNDFAIICKRSIANPGYNSGLGFSKRFFLNIN